MGLENFQKFHEIYETFRVEIFYSHHYWQDKIDEHGERRNEGVNRVSESVLKCDRIAPSNLLVFFFSVGAKHYTRNDLLYRVFLE